MADKMIQNHRESTVYIARWDELKHERTEQELKPGASIIDEAELALYMQVPAVAGMFKAKVLTVHEPEPAPGDILETIAKCNDVRALRRMIDQYAYKPEIREAILSRHTELTSGEHIEALKGFDVRQPKLQFSDSEADYV